MEIESCTQSIILASGLLLTPRVTQASMACPNDGNLLTKTFNLEDLGLTDAPKLFFRIEVE